MHQFDRQNDLVRRGLACWYRGRLIPVMRGGDENADLEADGIFAEVPDDLASLDAEALGALITDYAETIDQVCANPRQFLTAGVTPETIAALHEETELAVATLQALRAQAAQASTEPVVEPVVADELTDEQRAAFDALATSTEPVVEVIPEPVVAAAAPARRARLPRPTGERLMVERQTGDEQGIIPLVAAGGAHDILPGTRFQSELELADAMVERHRQFGQGGPGVQERYAIAKAFYKDAWGADRRLNGKDEEANFDIIRPVIDGRAIRQAFEARVREQDGHDSLVASGGLCAPVTPWYNLQYISVPVRPVMGSLPSFQADRGGLRYARPAALSAVTTGVGLITEPEDAAGGSMATKTCQVIPCPPFQETDVDTIYHCLQFGNLGARAFPELVAQWNNLVLAAHARLAEANLLTQIDAFSTQVTAGSLGLGASASLFSQIMTAAEGLRNRNRMDPQAVLRIMLPWWSISLLVSDVIRSQFQRFDFDQAAAIAMLRSINVEPTFYIDGAAGRNQVYGTQADGPLLPFPDTVVWYLFPEGAFLFLDAGMLELGIVRDSVLNKTNDFQIFGETFENVAYVGVESLAVVSSICDSGTVSLPTTITCPIDYTDEALEALRLDTTIEEYRQLAEEFAAAA